MARERFVDVHIPIVAGGIGVGPILVVPLLVLAFGVLLAVLVTVTHPNPHHTYYPRSCDPFCAATSSPTTSVEGVTR
ncbi:hypothetical protein [Nocardia sp. 852002-20019_SCH5090214]|uniref:hypothetical protein n=1 Tax=Nocardia sp. 852002-20019_SCH5090214 TaxID=1834087 RepID=UPI000B12F7A6|nr:hypothetical protein [Nocardia sp. 852002-20019_SCH5090214]